MAGLKRFQYVDKDHNSIVTDTIARLKQTYGENTWNDFEEDNVGRMIIEAHAYITDLMLFYLERQANETYLSTATERQNVINHCKLIGYKPKNSKPAQVEILVSIEQPHSYDITLPVGTILQTSEGVSFETLDNAIIKVGELTTTVIAIEGETVTEIIGVSNGKAWQDFYLPRSGVMNILNVTINDHSWQYVPSLADQLPEAEVFTAEVDAWRRAVISFGNGKSGKIPELDEKITVTYRIGGGTIGNVAPNTITTVRDVATDSRGNTIHVNITNPNWASGGAEPESIDSMKLWGPRWFETQNRCVTQQDTETFSVKFGNIAKAKAVVRERTGEANIIRIYVLTYGTTEGTLTTANQTLKDSLLEYLNHYKMFTDWLEIDDGLFTPVDFTGNVIISDGFTQANIAQAINEILMLGNVNFTISLRRVPAYGTNF